MSGRTCPICSQRPPAEKYSPFCSKRCADVDLQRWFSGAYAIPGEVADEETMPPPADEEG